MLRVHPLRVYAHCRRLWWHRLAARQLLASFTVSCLLTLMMLRQAQTWLQIGSGDSSLKIKASQVSNSLSSAALSEPTFSDMLAEVKLSVEQSLYKFDRPGQLLPLMKLKTESERQPKWRSRVARDWLASQRLLVAATIRDGVQGLPSSLGNLRRLRRLFNDSRLLVVENDSVDGTRAFLVGEAQRDLGLRLLGCSSEASQPCRLDIRYSSGRAHLPGSASMNRSVAEEIDRGLVMSALRNIYLEYAYRHFAGWADLLLVIDPDVTWTRWSLDRLVQGLYYFKTRPLLQQLCANTIEVPEHRLFDPCTLTFFLNKHFGEDSRYPAVDYYASIMRGPADLPPVKVDSCFQAFAFYRFRDLANNRLLYRRSSGEWMCEHNTLSRQLREVYLDPHMQLEVLSHSIK